MAVNAGHFAFGGALGLLVGAGGLWLIGSQGGSDEQPRGGRRAGRLSR